MRDIINPKRYQHLITEAQEAHFSGWDFSWLNDRMIQEAPPWDYAAIVQSHFSRAHTMLDMGTGGGELLASLAPLPAETHATETFPPNQPLAEARLAPLNVFVHKIQENDPLPFDDDYFDLVINRHDSFDAAQVYRILKQGGHFITQQVGGLDNLELNQVLQDSIDFPSITFNPTQALTELYDAGFSIQRAEQAALKTIFMDIGAVVYYLKAIPWQIPNFSPETQTGGLIKIHNLIERQGQFTTTAHRFLVIACKAMGFKE